MTPLNICVTNTCLIYLLPYHKQHNFVILYYLLFLIKYNKTVFLILWYQNWNSHVAVYVMLNRNQINICYSLIIIICKILFNLQYWQYYFYQWKFKQMFWLVLFYHYINHYVAYLFQVFLPKVFIYLIYNLYFKTIFYNVFIT